MKTGRRALLGCTAAALLARRAEAADRITVATWAGEYGQLLAYTVDDSLLKPLEITVAQELADASVRKAKMIAEHMAARGTLDVVCLDDIDAAAMAARGLWEPLSQIDVPRLPEIYGELRMTYAIPHVFTALVIAYNPRLAIPPPVSFADFWDPRFRNRVGFTDTLALYNIAAAALSHGGSVSDMAPGMAALRDLKRLGAQSFATNHDLMHALQTGAVSVAPMWKARIAYWRRLNINVAHAYPLEGAVPYVFTAGVPANAPNKQAAKRYLNVMLDPGVEATFALRLGYAPAVDDARLTGALDRNVGFSTSERSALRRLDYGYIARNEKELQDYWSNDFKAV